MTRDTGASIRRSLISVLILGSLAAGLKTFGMANPAKEVPDAGPVARLALRTPSLQQEFWYCDYVATKQFVDSALAGHCSAVTEELKKSFFGDDFNALLTWWEHNKASEHAALARAESE